MTVMFLFWPIIFFSLLLACPPVRADLSTISAIGQYRVGAYDSRRDAQRLAFLHAKWLLLDKITASLSDAPAVREQGFNRDELRAYLPGILRINEHPALMGAGASLDVASVEASAVVDLPEILRQLQRLVGDERAKVGLMQSRDKIETYRKELEADTQRLSDNTDPSRWQTLLEYRRETMVLIDSEEQVARNWAELAHTPESPRPRSFHKNDHPYRPHAGGPGNAEEHRKRGAALNEQGKYDEALQEFRVALQLMPTLTRAHLGLGAALQGKGDLDGAIAEYRKILHAHPEDPDAHNNLGTVLQRKGDLTGAIAEYRAALQGQPDDALIHFNLGTALSVTGAEDPAIVEYRTTVQLRPDFAPGYFYLGTILKQKRQMREAAEAFRSYLSLAPNTPDHQPWIDEAQKFLLEKDVRKGRPDR